MRHPNYKIMQVSVNNGVRTNTIVSKELMFKTDALRVARFKNYNDAVFNDVDNAVYYVVVDKEHNTVAVPNLQGLKLKRGE